jgi:hypothetical protein
MPKPIRRKKSVAYCSLKPLKCCEFASLQRCLGVEIGKEFTHQGLKKQMAECTYETVTVNTVTYGGPKFPEEIPEEKVRMTAQVIADIIRVMDELRDHKARLLEEMKK